MFSWQSSFFFQYLIDSYEKGDDTSRGNIISALVSYRFPELFIKFILNKGNPQMIPPNTLQCYFSLVVDYCISADFKINDTTLLQIISFLEKVLFLQQTPKMFQKLEAFFFVTLGTNVSDVEKLFEELKKLSILPLTYLSFLNKFKVNEIYSTLISSADSYLNSSNSKIYLQAISSLFKSGVKFNFDLLAIYSLCDKISDLITIPLYFRVTFFDSLTYFLSPMNSFQIAKNHFFKISEQITTSSTVNDLVSIIHYSKHLATLRRKNEISGFTVDMISEIVFLSILPHFRKSKKLQEAFSDYCSIVSKAKLTLFASTHFTTSSLSAKQFLISYFECDQDAGVLFAEPLDNEIIHQYVSTKKIDSKYLVHFLEYSNVNDYKFIEAIYQTNPKVFCEKVIQYLPICDDIEKMNHILSFLMSFSHLPLIPYTTPAPHPININSPNNKQSDSEDNTFSLFLDSAFLSVLLHIIQFPNNQNNKSLYCFLLYLKCCREYSPSNFLPNSSSNTEITPKKAPKRVRRTSNETKECQPTQKRRLSDVGTPSKSPAMIVNQNLRNSLVATSTREFFNTPKKNDKKSSKSNPDSSFNVKNNIKKQFTPSHIRRIVASIEHWNDQLLSILYTKIDDGYLVYGVLVSFFTINIQTTNQIGKILSPYPRLLKLFFSTSVSANNDFISEIMKYILYHKDLIKFRIELVLQSFLTTFSIGFIDDSFIEIIKIGFNNNFFDLTCSVISTLLEQSPTTADPERILSLLFQVVSYCDPIIFHKAFRLVVQVCGKLTSNLIPKVVQTWIGLTKYVNDTDFEKILLADPESHNIFIEEFRSKYSHEYAEHIGYFHSLKRLAGILQLDEMKPLYSRIILNSFSQNKPIRAVVRETLQILFDDDFKFLETSSSNDPNNKMTKVTDKIASDIIQDLFKTVNFQNKHERKALLFCLRKYANIYPKALLLSDPPLIPQIVSMHLIKVENGDLNTSSFIENESISQDTIIQNELFFSVNEQKYIDIIINLAKPDIVLFYNQLMLSQRCNFFDKLILKLCQCKDISDHSANNSNDESGIELFACIENEFHELRDRTINFSFSFQMLTQFIRYNLDEKDDQKIASLLFIIILCISESYNTNNQEIIAMLKEPIRELELILSIPLLPARIDSIQHIYDRIPYPLFSNTVIQIFITQCEKLISTKHQKHFEILLCSLLSSFSNNPQIFQQLINVYLKLQNKTEKGSRLQFSSIVKIFNNQQLKLCKDKLPELFEISLKEKLFTFASKCALFLNEKIYFYKLFLHINDFSDSDAGFLFSTNFYNCINKATKFHIFSQLDNSNTKKDANSIDPFSLIKILQKELFHNNEKSINAISQILNLNESKSTHSQNPLPFEQFFFYCINQGSLDPYYALTDESFEHWYSLPLITPFELKTMFYIIQNLIGFSDYEEKIKDFFIKLPSMPLNKEAKALASNLIQQYTKDPYQIIFPTILKPQKYEMYHI